MGKAFLRVLAACGVCTSITAYSQVGGTHTFAFLDLPNSARIASLGGKMVAITDDDPDLVYFNPSLLNPGMDQHLALSYINYFAGINYGYASYSKSVQGIGNFSAAMHYVNYGEFTAATETGIITGQFQAAEYALHLVYSRPIDSNFTVGITLKPIYSSLEDYQSFGLATDLGASYHSSDNLFTASIVLRNLGFQFKSYYNQQQEPLPFDIEIGISQKLGHAPFRFIFTADQLQKPDLNYTLPDNLQKVDPVTGLPIKQNALASFSDKLMRHLLAGVEFFPIRGFTFRMGYNYQRRQELQVEARSGMVGFSWGFGLKISKFNLNYGRATYHLGGASNHFSVSANLSDFYHRKTETN